MMQMNKQFVSVKQMAAILNVHVSWLYGRTRFGARSIPHVRFGKYIRFNPEEVIEFFKQKAVQ
jgi:excisionase family DNA binding protein